MSCQRHVGCKKGPKGTSTQRQRHALQPHDDFIDLFFHGQQQLLLLAPAAYLAGSFAR